MADNLIPSNQKIPSLFKGKKFAFLSEAVNYSLSEFNQEDFEQEQEYTLELIRDYLKQEHKINLLSSFYNYLNYFDDLMMFSYELKNQYKAILEEWDYISSEEKETFFKVYKDLGVSLIDNQENWENLKLDIKRIDEEIIDRLDTLKNEFLDEEDLNADNVDYYFKELKNFSKFLNDFHLHDFGYMSEQWENFKIDFNDYVDNYSERYFDSGLEEDIFNFTSKNEIEDIANSEKFKDWFIKNYNSEIFTKYKLDEKGVFQVDKQHTVSLSQEIQDISFNANDKIPRLFFRALNLENIDEEDRENLKNRGLGDEENYSYFQGDYYTSKSFVASSYIEGSEDVAIYSGFIRPLNAFVLPCVLQNGRGIYEDYHYYDDYVNWDNVLANYSFYEALCLLESAGFGYNLEKGDNIYDLYNAKDYKASETKEAVKNYIDKRKEKNSHYLPEFEDLIFTTQKYDYYANQGTDKWEEGDVKYPVKVFLFFTERGSKITEIVVNKNYKEEDFINPNTNKPYSFTELIGKVSTNDFSYNLKTFSNNKYEGVFFLDLVDYAGAGYLSPSETLSQSRGQSIVANIWGKLSPYTKEQQEEDRAYFKEVRNNKDWGENPSFFSSLATARKMLKTERAEIDKQLLAKTKEKIKSVLKSNLGSEILSNIEVLTLDEAKKLDPSLEKLDKKAVLQGFFISGKKQEGENPSAGKLVIIADSFVDREDLAVFTAYHELGHKIIDFQGRNNWLNWLNEAGKNETVRAIADKTEANYRKSGKNIDDLTAIEEALVDIFAAYKAQDWQRLEQRHGITLSENFKKKSGEAEQLYLSAKKNLEKVFTPNSLFTSLFSNNPNTVKVSDEAIFAMLGHLEQTIKENPRLSKTLAEKITELEEEKAEKKAEKAQTELEDLRKNLVGQFWGHNKIKDIYKTPNGYQFLIGNQWLHERSLSYNKAERIHEITLKQELSELDKLKLKVFYKGYKNNIQYKNSEISEEATKFNIKHSPHKRGSQLMNFARLIQTVELRLEQIGWKWEEQSISTDTYLSLSPKKSVKASIARGKKSMNKALLDKADVHRAMYRSGIGWVDFVYGRVGRLQPNGKTKGGMGLIHIIDARMRKDNMSYEQVVEMLTNDIVNTIGLGISGSNDVAIHGKDMRLRLRYLDNVAILIKQAGSNSWLLNGFKEKQTVKQIGVATNSALLTTSPILSRQGVGASAITHEGQTQNLNLAETSSKTAPQSKGEVSQLINSVSDSDNTVGDIKTQRNDFDNSKTKLSLTLPQSDFTQTMPNQSVSKQPISAPNPLNEIYIGKDNADNRFLNKVKAELIADCLSSNANNNNSGKIKIVEDTISQLIAEAYKKGGLNEVLKMQKMFIQANKKINNHNDVNQNQDLVNKNRSSPKSTKR